MCVAATRRAARPGVSRHSLVREQRTRDYHRLFSSCGAAALLDVPHRTSPVRNNPARPSSDSAWRPCCLRFDALSGLDRMMIEIQRARWESSIANVLRRCAERSAGLSDLMVISRGIVLTSSSKCLVSRRLRSVVASALQKFSEKQSRSAREGPVRDSAFQSSRGAVYLPAIVLFEGPT